MGDRSLMVMDEGIKKASNAKISFTDVQIHFPTNSLSHLNSISSFIHYSLFILFLVTAHLLTFFYSIPDYYNRKNI